ALPGDSSGACSISRSLRSGQGCSSFTRLQGRCDDRACLDQTRNGSRTEPVAPFAAGGPEGRDCSGNSCCGEGRPWCAGPAAAKARGTRQAGKSGPVRAFAGSVEGEGG